jgi:hypothetical protein
MLIRPIWERGRTEQVPSRKRHDLGVALAAAAYLLNPRRLHRSVPETDWTGGRLSDPQTETVKTVVENGSV